jgi:hypothetical protein
MSHVDGVDDGVGYGVQGTSQKNAGVVGGSSNWAGLYCNSSQNSNSSQTNSSINKTRPVSFIERKM